MRLLNNFWKLLKQTYNRMWEFDIGLHGAGIAFYAIFSTAPLIIILVWLISFFMGDQIGQKEFQETLQSIVGVDVAKSISQVVESTSQDESGFWSSLVAIFTLLFGATTLLSQMKYSLNMIWGIKNPQLGTVWSFLWDRFVGLLFIGSLSILFLAGLISESLIYGLENILLPFLGAEDLSLIQVGTSVTNFFLTLVFFTAMFQILPDLEARWRDIAVGAIVTALLFLAGKAVVGWYLGAGGVEPTYKAAGSFVIFLIWIYYNVQIILIGAIFTQIYTSRYGGDIQPYWGAKLDDDFYHEVK